MSIILVDDNKVNLFVLEKILKSVNYPEAIFLQSAHELYDYLHIFDQTASAKSVDLILLDIMMPEIDGIEACKKIRQDDRYKNTQIIFTTALDDKKKLAEALAAGGNDYVTKPINRTELIARIEVALRLKKELDWHAQHEKNIEAELMLATQVQRSLLSKPVEDDKIRIQVNYEPTSNLAGDMYYWNKIDDHRYAVMLFDMMGHGIPAALVCMYISSVLRESVDTIVKPTEVMQELNRYMTLLHSDLEKVPYYFTAIYMLIDTKEKTIEYVNAGHPSGYACLDGEHLEKLEHNSCAIGFFADAPMTAHKITYTNSVQIIAFTDGVLEAMHEDEIVAESRMAELAKQHWESPKALLRDAIPANHPSQKDDMCVMLVSINDAQ